MKIKFRELTLRTKQADYEIPFSDSISYFYGKIGAGKSTIPRLIDFCLGGDLKETPAMQQEFVSVSLELNIGKHSVKLDRSKGETSVIAAWRELPNGDPMAMQVPIRGQKGKFLIPGTKVESISDLLFYLSGLEPPFVLKSKHNVESELVRLSFRDLMWYCYLDQDRIDSSFFHLYGGDDPFKRNKSQDAVRFIFGFHFEEVTKLEADIATLRSEKAAVTSAMNQLRDILQETGIDVTKDLQASIQTVEKELKKTDTELSTIHKKTFVRNHPIDDLKEQSRRLSDFVDNIKEKIEDISFQITNQNRLKSEYITASMKIDRTSVARGVFRNLHFDICPQCGQHLGDVKEAEICSLCHRPPDSEPVESLKTMGPDLIERIKEIDSSVDQLTHEKKRLENKLTEKQREKSELDDRLSSLQRDYDSNYLSQTKELMKNKSSLEGKLQYLKRLLPIPQKVDDFQKESDKLTIKIERLKEELDDEQKKAIEKQSLLKDLEKMFMYTLKQVNFPGMRDDHKVEISPKNYIPVISSKKSDDPTTTHFANLGSGGKKTIFKSCYALAVHRLAAKMGTLLPTFLIIDTPMKNISERENVDIFKGFYNFVFKLAEGELKGRQIIIIDKEYYEGKTELPVVKRHMTPDNPKYPPLIQYYRGP